jgi:hypothetical protein
MKMHQGREGKGLGRLTNGMLCEDLGQSDCLVAELSTDRHLRMRREITLGEQQVEDRVHGGEARRGIRFTEPCSDEVKPASRCGA